MHSGTSGNPAVFSSRRRITYVLVKLNSPRSSPVSSNHKFNIIMEDDDTADLEFSTSSFLDSSLKHRRVIIHIDIDCFYAQVEEILNPTLVGKPLGIQQKNLVVTCNYVARRLGVKKLMGVQAAKGICPTLILINGEDLKKYREMSDKIYQVLQSYSSYVEKLGLDENFIDVTSSVEANKSDNNELEGHVFGDVKETCECGCKKHLIKGSIIAGEIRAQLKSELGISSCAGIAHNKLLAKLAGTTHKPNQQTTLFPSSALLLVSTLSSPKALPGIGSSTYKKLLSLGLDTIDKLQKADTKDLVRSFGAKLAHHIQQLSFGVDENPVKVTDKPKSIGAEDGFPIVRTDGEIQDKLDSLLDRVWDLVVRGGRKPTNIKLTVRKVLYAPEKHNTRESRQTAISIGSSCCTSQLDCATKGRVIQTLMSLFRKIIGNESGWMVTLLGISFGGFPSESSPIKNSIFKYFGSNKSPVNTNQSKGAMPSTSAQEAYEPPAKRNRIDESVLRELPPEIRQEILNDIDSYAPQILLGTSETKPRAQVSVTNCPDDIDPGVFGQLPPEIQEELLQETKRKTRAPIAVDKKPNNLLGYFRKV